MGLDMYLYTNLYVTTYKGRLQLISTEAIYWRKANAIHAWFVKNCQNEVDNCAIYPVPREKLEKLQEECLQVLKDKELAYTLLPPCDGFFFGPTALDEYYFSQLEYTAKEIKELLANTKETEDIYFSYRSSW